MDVFVSITGDKTWQWMEKIDELKKFKLTQCGLFIHHFAKEDRPKIYAALADAGIKEVPLVHIGNDMSREELALLQKRFCTTFFNVHTSGLSLLHQWGGFTKNILLEFHSEDTAPDPKVLERIGGFCIDLAHFRKSQERGLLPGEFIPLYEKRPQLFRCCHISGYSPENKMDLHTISGMHDFAYLATIPTFLVGKFAAIEVFNPIKDQLVVKKHLQQVFLD